MARRWGSGKYEQIYIGTGSAMVALLLAGEVTSPAQITELPSLKHALYFKNTHFERFFPLNFFLY
jgi:hypothetical protein